MRSWFARALLRNLVACALVFVPVALIVFALIQAARGEGEFRGPVDLFELTVLYPGLVLYTAPGAVLFTLALTGLARVGRAGRLWTAVLTPVVLLPWALTPARALFMFPPFVLGVAAGLALFARLAATAGPAPSRQAAV